MTHPSGHIITLHNEMFPAWGMSKFLFISCVKGLIWKGKRMECAQAWTATLLKLYVKTQGVPGFQSTFPPDFREWPSGSSTFRPCYSLLFRQERLPCSWVVTLPSPVLIAWSSQQAPTKVISPAWLGTSVPLHALLWESLGSFNCTAVVAFTDQGCWELEECGLERLGNGEGQSWDNRWRSE